jgi:hypothetical protein
MENRKFDILTDSVKDICDGINKKGFTDFNVDFDPNGDFGESSIFVPGDYENCDFFIEHTEYEDEYWDDITLDPYQMVGNLSYEMGPSDTTNPFIHPYIRENPDSTFEKALKAHVELRTMIKTSGETVDELDNNFKQDWNIDEDIDLTPFEPLMRSSEETKYAGVDSVLAPYSEYRVAAGPAEKVIFKTYNRKDVAPGKIVNWPRIKAIANNISRFLFTEDIINPEHRKKKRFSFNILYHECMSVPKEITWYDFNFTFNSNTLDPSIDYTTEMLRRILRRQDVDTGRVFKTEHDYLEIEDMTEPTEFIEPLHEIVPRKRVDEQIFDTALEELIKDDTFCLDISEYMRPRESMRDDTISWNRVFKSVICAYSSHYYYDDIKYLELYEEYTNALLTKDLSVLRNIVKNFLDYGVVDFLYKMFRLTYRSNRIAYKHYYGMWRYFGLKTKTVHESTPEELYGRLLINRNFLVKTIDSVLEHKRQVRRMAGEDNEMYTLFLKYMGRTKDRTYDLYYCLGEALRKKSNFWARYYYEKSTRVISVREKIRLQQKCILIRMVKLYVSAGSLVRVAFNLEKVKSHVQKWIETYQRKRNVKVPPDILEYVQRSDSFEAIATRLDYSYIFDLKVSWSDVVQDCIRSIKYMEEDIIASIENFTMMRSKEDREFLENYDVSFDYDSLIEEQEIRSNSSKIEQVMNLFGSGELSDEEDFLSVPVVDTAEKPFSSVLDLGFGLEEEEDVFGQCNQLNLEDELFDDIGAHVADLLPYIRTHYPEYVDAAQYEDILAEVRTLYSKNRSLVNDNTLEADF